MTVFERIATSVSVNRSTAMAAQGTYRDPELTPEQKLDVLRDVLRGYQLKIAVLAKSDPQRRDLVLKVQNLQSELTAAKAARKPGIPRNVDLGEFILAVVQERTPKPVWQGIVREAERRFVEAAAKGEQSP